MHLSQKDRYGKSQRECTAKAHDVIRASEALFRTLTTPCGYQEIEGGFLELGVCRNCGSTLARQPDTTTACMLELATGGGR